MAYRALIRRYIDKAFAMLQDIPVIVTFKKRGERTFDFTTGKASPPTEQTKRVKVVILSGERRDKDVNIIFKKLILRHDLIATVRQYDVVEIDGVDWTVGDLVKSDVDFVEFLEVFKEATDKKTAIHTCMCYPHEDLTLPEIQSIFDGTYQATFNTLLAAVPPMKPHICECKPHEDITKEEIESIMNNTLDSLLPSLYNYNKFLSYSCECLPHEDITAEDIREVIG